MSQEQKESRHCIPCNSRGNHTSLDHRYCPEKRKIIQERIKTARELRNIEDNNQKRDTDLIKKVRRLSKTGSCAPHRYVADTAAVIVNVVLYTLVARRPVVVLYY